MTEKLDRHGREISERASIHSAECLQILAGVPAPGAALWAMSAGKMGFRRNPVSDPESFVSADVDDLATEFMAKRKRRSVGPRCPRVPADDVQVSPADTGVADLNQGFVGLQGGQIAHDEIDRTRFGLRHNHNTRATVIRHRRDFPSL